MEIGVFWRSGPKGSGGSKLLAVGLQTIVFSCFWFAYYLPAKLMPHDPLLPGSHARRHAPLHRHGERPPARA